MPKINANYIPYIAPTTLFDRLANDNAISVRWLDRRDPLFFETLNRPTADLAVRQLIIAKAIDRINLCIAFRAMFPFMLQPHMNGSNIPMGWIHDMHVTIPEDFSNLRLSRIHRVDGHNAGSMCNPGESYDDYTGHIRLVFSADWVEGGYKDLFTVTYCIDETVTYQRSRVDIVTDSSSGLYTPCDDVYWNAINGQVTFRTLDQTQADIRNFYNNLPPITGGVNVGLIGDSIEETVDENVIDNGSGLLTDLAYNLDTGLSIVDYHGTPLSIDKIYRLELPGDNDQGLRLYESSSGSAILQTDLTGYLKGMNVYQASPSNLVVPLAQSFIFKNAVVNQVPNPYGPGFAAEVTPSSVTDIGELGNVEIHSPADSDALRYDESFDVWRNTPDAPMSLNDLSDVNVDPVVPNNDRLTYDTVSGLWVNAPDDGGGGGGGGTSSEWEWFDVDFTGPTPAYPVLPDGWAVSYDSMMGVLTVQHGVLDRVPASISILNKDAIGSPFLPYCQLYTPSIADGILIEIPKNAANTGVQTQFEIKGSGFSLLGQKFRVFVLLLPAFDVPPSSGDFPFEFDVDGHLQPIIGDFDQGAFELSAGHLVPVDDTFVDDFFDLDASDNIMPIGMDLGGYGFEYDAFDNLMPTTNPSVDGAFELSGSDHLMPAIGSFTDPYYETDGSDNLMPAGDASPVGDTGFEVTGSDDLMPHDDPDVGGAFMLDALDDLMPVVGAFTDPYFETDGSDNIIPLSV